MLRGVTLDCLWVYRDSYIILYRYGRGGSVAVKDKNRANYDANIKL